VGEAVLRWRQELGPGVSVAVVEVPLLFEAAMEDAFDATVAVVAEDGIRDQRLTERGQPGLEGREARQIPQHEKARRADHVIRNDETLEQLDGEVREIVRRLAAEDGAG
jgi:dephospho-CoA kinase